MIRSANLLTIVVIRNNRNRMDTDLKLLVPSQRGPHFQCCEVCDHAVAVPPTSSGLLMHFCDG